MLHNLSIRKFMFALLTPPVVISFGLAAVAHHELGTIHDLSNEAAGGSSPRPSSGQLEILRSWDDSLLHWAVLGQILLVALLAVILLVSIRIRLKLRVDRLLVAGNRVKGGDLTAAPKRLKGDELGRLEELFGSMVRTVHRVISDLRSSASSIRYASHETADSARIAGDEVSAVAQAINSVAERTSRQAEIASRVNDALTQVNDGVQAMAETAKHASGRSTESHQASSDAAGRAQTIQDSMEEVSESVSQTARIVASLETKSNAIAAIVGSIGSVAHQTNLLALNAAIEAARAGKDGEGFSVVADEVRQLADDSRKAADNIGGLLALIVDDIARAVDGINAEQIRIAEGLDAVESNRAAFEAISGSIENLHGRSRALEEVSVKLEDLSGVVAKRVGEVAALAGGASASAQEISASTQQTSAAAQEVSAIAHSVATSAEQLEVLAAKFKIAEKSAA